MQAVLCLLSMITGEAGTDRDASCIAHPACDNISSAAGAAAVSAGLYSAATNSVIAQTDLAGNLVINSVYQIQNDIPAQREALTDIYNALGGDYWNAAYKYSAAAELVSAYEDTLSTTSKLAVSEHHLIRSSTTEGLSTEHPAFLQVSQRWTTPCSRTSSR